MAARKKSARKKSARKKKSYTRTVTFRRAKAPGRKRKNPKAKAAFKRAEKLLAGGKAKTWGSALKKAWSSTR